MLQFPLQVDGLSLCCGVTQRSSYAWTCHAVGKRSGQKNKLKNNCQRRGWRSGVKTCQNVKYTLHLKCQEREDFSPLQICLRHRHAPGKETKVIAWKWDYHQADIFIPTSFILAAILDFLEYVRVFDVPQILFNLLQICKRWSDASDDILEGLLILKPF